MSEATQWMELLLRKRDMDQRAEAVDEAQRAAQTRQLFQAAGGAAEAMGGAMKQAKLDDIANSLMNAKENIPRAQAVDPSLQAKADAKAAKMPGYHTGGLAEMRLAMGMDEWKQKQIDSLLRREQAEQAMKLRQQNADSLDAYRAGQLDLRTRQMEERAKATAAEQHAAAAGLTPTYLMTKARRYDPTPSNITPFISPEQTAASAAHQATLDKAKAESSLPPPAEAVNALLADPVRASEFDAKYGQGAAAAYLE